MGCVYLCKLRHENLPVILSSRPNCVPVFITTNNIHITPKTGCGWTCHRNSGSSQSHGFLSTHSTTAGVNVHTKPRIDEQCTCLCMESWFSSCEQRLPNICIGTHPCLPTPGHKNIYANMWIIVNTHKDTHRGAQIGSHRHLCQFLQNL